MSKSIEAAINPDLLVWARESVGISPQQLAKKLKVEVSTLNDWETGRARPSVVQLRKASEACKRPLAVFYLAARPKGGFQPLKDYRRIHGAEEFHDTVALNFEIRQAEHRRQIALELLEELDESVPKFEHRAKLADDRENLGLRVRQLLGIDLAQQLKWRDNNEALNRWRAAIEKLGVFVFQATTIAPDEMRGFSTSQFPLPVIVLNRKDAETARIFTLIHELTHIMLHQGGICDIHEDYKRSADEQRVEVFCNHIAGAALVSRQDLKAQYDELKNNGACRTLDEFLPALATRFKVSKEVVLRRFLTFRCIQEALYERKRKEFLKEYAELREQAKKSKKPVIISPPRNVISTAGFPFVQLVLNGYHQEKITSSDLTDFLAMKADHLPKLQAEVESKAVRFWSAP